MPVMRVSYPLARAFRPAKPPLGSSLYPEGRSFLGGCLWLPDGVLVVRRWGRIAKHLPCSPKTAPVLGFTVTRHRVNTTAPCRANRGDKGRACDGPYQMYGDESGIQVVGKEGKEELPSCSDPFSCVQGVAILLLEDDPTTSDSYRSSCPLSRPWPWRHHAQLVR